MEKGRISQRLSIKPRNSEKQTVEVKGPTQSSPPVAPSRLSYAQQLFTEKSLVFLGIIASILALSFSLWSMHKNSETTRRLNALNSSVVDLIVKQKSAPVVEIGRKDVNPQGNTTRLGKFKERREAKKQAAVVPPILEETIRDIAEFTKEQEKERVIMLDEIKRQTDENIRRMEQASKEALQEGNKSHVKNKQLMSRASKMKVNHRVGEDEGDLPVAEKIFDTVNKFGETILPAFDKFEDKPKFSVDIDVDELEKDLRLLTGR